MRAKAMMSHYLRSLAEEKDFEEWDNGTNIIPPDERKKWYYDRFGTKTLAERGITNIDFVSMAGIDVRCHSIGCDNDVTDVIFGYPYCADCIEEFGIILNQQGRA